VEELKKFVGKDFTCFFAKIFFIRFFTPEYFDTAFFVWDIRKKRSKKLHLGFFICKFATLKSFTKSIQFQVREGLDFAECRYIDHALVFASDQKRLPMCMRPCFYWTACILLLGWPLRLFIDWRMAHVEYRLTKLFGTNLLR
jgi:hypothetical protein